MADCVRRCTHYRRHLQECRVDDHQTEVWIPVSVTLSNEDQQHLGETRDGQWGGKEVKWTCTGCKPRHATHGRLCTACHNRLKGHLTGPRNIPWLDTWLTLNVQPSVGAQSEKLSRSKIAGSPAPGRVPIWDTRQLLRDRVLIEIEPMIRDEFNLDDPPKPNTLRQSAAFIAAWQTKIENELDAGVLERICWLLDDVFTQARKVAPWDTKGKPLPVPCPECSTRSLIIPNGEEDVTCQRCKYTITEPEFVRFAFVLAQDLQHMRPEGMITST